MNKNTNNLEVKIRKLKLAVIVAVSIAGTALLGCLVCIIFKLKLEAPFLDYTLAIVGFIGAVTGVFIPLTIGQRNELITQQNEINNLVYSVYDELTTYYNNFSKNDFFSFATPAWESFKINYIHFVGLNKDFSEKISEIYTQIIKLNQIVSKYEEINESQTKERIVLVSKYQELKILILNSLKKFLEPSELLIEKNEVTSFSFSKTEENEFTSEENLISEISQILSVNSELFSNFDLNDYSSCDLFISMLEKLLNSNKNLNFYYRILSIEYFNGKMLVNVFKLSKTIELYSITNKNVATDVAYYDYFDLLPTLLLMDGISASKFSTYLKLADFEKACHILPLNVVNDNACFFLLTEALKTNCLNELFEHIIQCGQLDTLLILNNLIYSVDYSANNYKNGHDLLEKASNSLMNLNVENLDEEKKWCGLFIKKYAESNYKKEYIEFKIDEECKYSDLLNNLYRQLYFCRNFKNGINEVPTKDRINILTKEISTIDECIKNYSLYHNNLIDYTRCVLFPLNVRKIFIYESISNLDSKKRRKNNATILKEIDSIFDAICNFDDLKPWSFNKFYFYNYLLTDVILAKQTFEHFSKNSVFTKVVDKAFEIINKYKNTIIEEIYCSILLKIISNCMEGFIVFLELKDLEFDEIVNAFNCYEFISNYSEQIENIFSKLFVNYDRKNRKDNRQIYTDKIDGLDREIYISEQFEAKINKFINKTKD